MHDTVLSVTYVSEGNVCVNTNVQYLSQQNAAQFVRLSAVSLSVHKNSAQVQWIAIKYLQLNIYIYMYSFYKNCYFLFYSTFLRKHLIGWL